MKKTYLFLALVMVMVSVHTGIAAQAAQKAKGKDKKEPVVNTVVKEVQGVVSNITSRSLSLVYDRNEDTGVEQEMLFPIDAGNIKVEHKRGLSEISQGDTVLIIYREETSDYGDRTAIRNVADVVRFLKPADANSPYKPRAAATEEEQEPAGLSLKGVK